MAVTKTNINTEPNPVNNSPSEPSFKRDTKKTIKVHKSYADAVDYAKRIIMPTGIIDTVYYRDEDDIVTCLIVVGNVPNNTPIVFTGILHIETSIDAVAEQVTEDVTESANEYTDNTVTYEVNKLISNYTKWNEFNGSTDSSTDSSTDASVSGGSTTDTSVNTGDTPADSSAGEIADDDDDSSDISWGEFGG